MDKRQDKSALAFSPLPRPSGTRRGSFQPPGPALLFVEALKPGAILLRFLMSAIGAAYFGQIAFIAA
ncbi:MAG: hypothetical protein DU429_06530 [Candidatus Tokpelaia sp.]|nr:MAG: hypothetical protein DU430_04480 [Candidatus Tokpelaia sp.]KAA6206218.1 MAG: hypothetical protein DU429_06530 [Candidatus Tokpelaia sp.]